MRCNLLGEGLNRAGGHSGLAGDRDQISLGNLEGMIVSRVQEKLKTLPARPGVYLYKDDAGNVIYVGKAANLSNRIRSYFVSPAALFPKQQKMVSRIADIEFIITASEQEAIILECNLIKKHKPYYNVRLKDDKSYPYIKVNMADQWPNVQVTRRIIDDGGRYFGPFASAHSLRKTMNVIKKLFPYRNCKKPITGTDTRPCLEYHINRCAGPCIGAVSNREYDEIIAQVMLFLEGKQESVLRELKRKMADASSALEFERAALLRDQIEAIESIMEQQKVVSLKAVDEDIIAIAKGKNEACAQVLFVRGGKLIGTEHFNLEGVQDEAHEDITTSFVAQFYGAGASIPEQILLETELRDTALFEDWLREKRRGKVRLRVPKRGEKKRLILMAAENAAESLEQMRIKWLADSGKTAAALEQLKEVLGLPRLPRRMECYDISSIQGTAAVGSMVVFEEGRPKQSLYRRFKIRTVSGVDDYAMMQEMLRRRFARRVGEDSDGAIGSWAVVPDLVIIDGGKGHLNAALDVLRRIGVVSVPVAGIAKENEEVFLPNLVDPIILPRNSQGLYLLQRIRDEAHRFALSYHIKTRTKATIKSQLDDVPGIGAKHKRALLRRFGSIKAIRDASIEELVQVDGVSKSLAERLKYFI